MPLSKGQPGASTGLGVRPISKLRYVIRCQLMVDSLLVLEV